MSALIKKLFLVTFCLAGIFVFGPNHAIAASDIITSGNYQYIITNEADKTIEIQKVSGFGVNVEIPDKIDGYSVTGIGSSNDQFAVPVFVKDRNEKDTVIKKLIIPKSVKYIGYNACMGLSSMEKLIMPDDIMIKDYGFAGASSLRELSLKEGCILGYDAFTDMSLDKLSITGNVVRDQEGSISGKTAKMIISPSEATSIFNAHGLGIAEDVYVDGEISRLVITDSIATGNLYIYGLKTVLVLEKENPLYQGETSVCNRIITYEGAKAVLFAKEHRINYSVVSKPCKLKVKSVKSKNGYTYSWKKKYVKRSEYTLRANRSRKVKTTKKKASYNIYVKKSGKYRLVKTTRKTKYKTKKKIRITTVNELI